MNRPYCSDEMEAGVIQSPQEIARKRNEAFVGASEFQEGSVVLAEHSFIKGSSVPAYFADEVYSQELPLLAEVRGRLFLYLDSLRIRRKSKHK